MNNDKNYSLQGFDGCLCQLTEGGKYVWKVIFSWTGVRFPAEARFFLLHSFQTGSGAHSASYPMGIGGNFPGLKWPGLKLTAHDQIFITVSQLRSCFFVGHPL
jgi:hypothetical protein